MTDPAPDFTNGSDPHPDATLMPGSGSGYGHGPDVTQVRTPDPGPHGPAPAEFLAPDESGVDVAGYELLDELGRGGMGVVYKARQRSLNRLVALKMVLSGAHASPADRARFRAEAEVVARLQHPNIVQIYEIGELAGAPYLALELVSGGTLQKTLAGTPQPVRPAAYLVELLARAIHFAHQRGVVHRDLKPGNVLLAVPLDGASSISDQDGAQVAALYGVPKVTDFGLAKRLEDDAHNTRSGDIIGTPSYMAPEQAGGRGPIGPAADVYALGAVLYDMLTGRPPFKGATTFETIQQVRTEEPVLPSRLRPRLPKDLERICLKCLEKDPRRRYATALDLATDLRRHLNGESVHARSATPLERTWRWTRRNPVPAGLLLAITLGSAVGFWHLSELSKSLVRSSALEGAVQQAEMMNELNRYYGRVAAHLKGAGVEGEPDWEKPGEMTMPPPATMTIDLGQQISARSESGVQVRLYSDFPFKRRLSRPPPDGFEQEALNQLRRDPARPFYRFEDLDGRPVLRYATARVMETGCVDCHNNSSDRSDNWPIWKEGDVRGVLEIIRPLDQDQQRINRGLRGTVLIVSGSGASLLGLSVLLVYLGNRRTRVTAPHMMRPATEAAPLPAEDGGDDQPTEMPSDSPHGGATPPPAHVPEEVVVWRTALPIGTLAPIRIVPPIAGTLRLVLEPEGETPPVELRVEVAGAPPVSGFGVDPFVEVAVPAGRVVNVRVRADAALDAMYTLTAELLTVRGTQQ
ncbi:protein kinase domain-containing protein [Frigoriglobus tundricola]|uniref:Serine/threonine protein kinase PrkC, regulator of stationary phase n=1 Tax=Frigoriglobus tundricola TaxID=2774151 RepID=A0A6M5YZD8_9BACT|nr:protein kinase [Frigoriglobus tundricola]QJW99497.1 Serine/threonine protein kinase PrkC, regulator of stationary phase [Frigoriglobus tundricola]